GEGGDVVGVAQHDPLEAVPDAQDRHALDDAADGGGGDDAVDAGGRAPAYEDREFLLVAHGSPPVAVSEYIAVAEGAIVTGGPRRAGAAVRVSARRRCSDGPTGVRS